MQSPLLLRDASNLISYSFHQLEKISGKTKTTLSGAQTVQCAVTPCVCSRGVIKDLFPFALLQDWTLFFQARGGQRGEAEQGPLPTARHPGSGSSRGGPLLGYISKDARGFLIKS